MIIDMVFEACILTGIVIIAFMVTLLSRRKYSKYVHNKTGNIYTVYTMNAIECTNTRDGVRYVVYGRDDMYFVREYDEFCRKFTKCIKS